MGCSIDRTWIEEQIVAHKAMIASVNAAILTLVTSNVATYSLDSGQTRQTVTKNQVGSLRLLLPELHSQLRYWQNQLCGGGTVYVRPGF